ncbi:conserved hypothetical protein [Rippkaea orientalis PCC 8801]|uniref:DUF2203 domain-containing protein n=1 Tax=Rippkaea orientalis (strain PCC 8801 / RF-1) TaxID=41431 RepID=B7K5W9_RIPO1|nr:hypothetical protein [Rippkaea orientalis]ACK68022.1 conserved hypothetical protein [Rippkaea orientalis PCC 8801]
MFPIEPNPSENEYLDFETALDETERSLIKLKERYQQIRQAQQRQREIEQSLEEMQLNDSVPSAQWEEQLQTLQGELQELSMILESRLLSPEENQGLLLAQVFFIEAFWQVVRFGGLGVLLGWLLKTWAG